MDNPCVDLSNSNWIEFFKIVPSLVTMILAFLTYNIGKKYFNKGHRNTIELSKYNKMADKLFEIQSLLSESKNILNKILNANTDASVAQSFLESFVQNHNETIDAFKRALFIENMASIKKDYLEWYEKWFEEVDSGMIKLIFDESNRALVIKQIGHSIIGEYSQIEKRVIEAARKIEPDTDIRD